MNPYAHHSKFATLLFMKKVILTSLIVVFSFAMNVFADEFQVFGIQFGDSQKQVREKLQKEFNLDSSLKYHRYLIGQGKYRILFTYDEDQKNLSEIKIYGKHFPLKKFRTEAPIAWKDLDDFTTALLGDGFGTIPHLLSVQKGIDNSDKDWEAKGVRADLGIQKDEMGYFVQLVLKPL
jgi:hypothetical protein